MILVNKNRCDTPYQVIEKLKTSNPRLMDKKISYAGRLDPMAQGLLLLLEEDENKNRESFQELTKEYTFTILFGVATDTFDVLGKITKTEIKEVEIEAIIQLLTQLKGEFLQDYPAYSSKTIEGKPMYYWQRQNKLSELSIPQKKVSINNLTFVTSEKINSKTIVKEILSDIAKVKGDFRQEEIMKDWELFNTNLDQDLLLVTLKAEVTSGTYIRSLVNTIGEKLAIPAIAYSIIRTRVGKYSLEDKAVITYE